MNPHIPGQEPKRLLLGAGAGNVGPSSIATHFEEAATLHLMPFSEADGAGCSLRQAPGLGGLLGQVHHC